MSDVQLDLADVRPPIRVPAARASRMVVVLLLLCTLLLGWLVWREISRGDASSGGTTLSGEGLRDLAMQLESLDLTEAAATVWSDYIAQSDLPPEKAAKLWYRVGTIQQRGRQFSAAAASYCRSQALCKVAELEPEIARRTQECLLTLGYAGALRRDIRQRTDIQPEKTAESAVLAEIGAWKVTRHEVERALEEQVEAAFSPFTSQGNETEALARRKADRLKELNQPEKFSGYLQQFIVQDLLYREARAAGLDETPEFRAFLRYFERDLLSRQQLEREITIVEPTHAECQGYYEAHRADFSQDGKPLDFETAAPRVTEKLRMERRQQAQQAYFNRLIDKYDVVFHKKTEERQP